MSKVEVEVKTTRTLGPVAKSDTATLEAMFPATPSLPGGYQGQYDNQELLTAHKELTNGVQSQNPDVTVDLDYGEAPNLDDAIAALPPDEQPGSPYTPRTGSPGVGLALGESAALAIPQAPPGHPGSGPPGQRAMSSGAGSDKMPSESSPQVATQAEGGGVARGNLTPGDSGVTS